MKINISQILSFYRFLKIFSMNLKKNFYFKFCIFIIQDQEWTGLKDVLISNTKSNKWATVMIMPESKICSSLPRFKMVINGNTCQTTFLSLLHTQQFSIRIAIVADDSVVPQKLMQNRFDYFRS